MFLLTSTSSSPNEAPARERFTWFMVVLLVMAYKSNDALTNPQFWAEDGRVFFSEQFGHAWPQLTTSYAGYLLTIPRLIAWCASWFPFAKAPLVYNAGAILLSAAAITFTCRRLRFFLPPWIVALSFLAVPTNGEIFGTLTNVQWFLQFFMAVCCLAPAIASRSPASPWIRACGVLLIALTGPFSALLLFVVAGLCGLSWLARRTNIDPFDGALAGFNLNRDWHSIAATAVGAVVQVCVIATTSQGGVSQDRPVWVLKTTFTELVPPHIFGSDFLTGTSWLVVYALLLFGVVAFRSANGSARLLVLGFLGFASIECFLPMLRMTDPEGLNPFSGDRYFYLLKVVWWWAVWMCLGAGNRRTRANATLVTTGLICLFATMNLPQMRRAAFKDFDWHGHSAILETPGKHSIPINPYDWRVEVERRAPAVDK
ncbi:hypothetical protein ACIGHF_05355 [Stenotrophomonas sp. NPDC077464]|uniref:hypothetical protein n=1 Tax=unclassified Stenotrophomonas TaxID=196198 RepID=UPI0037D5C493